MRQSMIGAMQHLTIVQLICDISHEQIASELQFHVGLQASDVSCPAAAGLYAEHD